MVTFTLAAPVNVGTLTSPVNVTSLQITTFNYSSTPSLAPIGTGTLTITLTDPVSGWQETVTYNDVSVLTLWNSPQSANANTQFGDIVASVLFAKLIADGRLPPGSISIH